MIEMPVPVIHEPRSSVELVKNTKGYQWTIKAYQAADESDDALLERVKAMDTQMRQEYGSES